VDRSNLKELEVVIDGLMDLTEVWRVSSCDWDLLKRIVCCLI
jgi:hypothetical protein